MNKIYFVTYKKILSIKMMKENKTYKAIFFDRDDTLIKDEGYMYKTEDLSLFPDTISVLKELQERGFKLFIVTNQSGIGRGFFTEEEMHKFNQNLLETLHNYGVTITDIVFCPHSPEENCDCRKPSPNLINNLCTQYNIDKSLSYMVGDKESDYQAGLNAGLKAIKIKPGSIKEILSLI